MEEKLLSISEAAKLIDVCENTLRDWDIEGKFKAFRTEGNHRRYSLSQIREFLERNPPQNKKTNQNQDQIVIKYNNTEHIKEWKEQGYLDGLEVQEQNVLAGLLSNTKTLYNSDLMIDSIFSTNQALWLVRESWLRVRFKKMVSIQPITAPCGLAFFNTEKNSLDSSAVAAKLINYSFAVFVKANFDDVKEAYANAIAGEIDKCILQKLPRLDYFECLDSLLLEKSETYLENLSQTCDYIIGTESLINKLKNKNLNIDFFEISPILDPENFQQLTLAGKYPKTLFDLPIFCPYQTLYMTASPSPYNICRPIAMRAGWCTSG